MKVKQLKHMNLVASKLKASRILTGFVKTKIFPLVLHSNFI